MLDAQTLPTHPVIPLSQNERTDDTYGYIIAPHTSLAGTSSTTYDLGDLEFSAY